jgi:hypothetical protein
MESQARSSVPDNFLDMVQLESVDVIGLVVGRVGEA